MIMQRYPFCLRIYKGEDRILIIPVINHIGGYSVCSEEFINIDNIGDYLGIGNSMLKAIEYIKMSPLSELTPKERELNAVWRKNSKYKSWNSFWKNNLYARVGLYQEGIYKICSLKKSGTKKGTYDEYLKEIYLSENASAEDIGKAVIDVFQAAEEYHKQNPTGNKKRTKKVQLLNGMELTMDEPADSHFTDIDDSGAAEIYQCYSYATSENAEPAAEFFIGIAPEIDCDLDIENVRASWEEYFGKADFFEMQEKDYGIFKYRVEMRNKESHKISYLLKQEEDLLLECEMEVHSPNRRKKTDEKLVGLFEQFAISCRM